MALLINIHFNSNNGATDITTVWNLFASETEKVGWLGQSLLILEVEENCLWKIKKNFKCKDMSEKYELSSLNIALLDSEYYFISNDRYGSYNKKVKFCF